MSLNVLIIEDEQEFRRYLTTAVPWSNYGLTVAGAVDDIAPARAILAKTRIDLVLLDITLQQHDGLELVTELKTQHPSPRVIVVTGHSEFETVQRALRLGVDDYLLKPFARQELLMSVIANRERMQEELRAARSRASMVQALIASWLWRLITAKSETEDAAAERALTELSVLLPPAPRVLACTSIQNSLDDDTRARWTEHSADVWRLATEQIAACVWIGVDQCVYTLLGGGEAQEIASEALETARELVKQSRRRLPVSMVVGISGVGKDTRPLSMYTLANQARSAMNHATKEQSVVVWDQSLEPDAYDSASETRAQERYRTATHFIEQYHTDPTLDVQTVASYLGVSTEYLRQIFQSEGGTTCIASIVQRRIAHAQHLLRETTIPIREVARRSGFRDAGYFSRTFRQATGIRPREYRAQ